jgi:hypothetical protein
VFRQMIQFQDDFAILKFQVTAHATCIRPSLKPLGPGEKIWAIGFPRSATRPYGHSSDGVSKYASYGEIYDGIEHNSFYRASSFDDAQIQRLNSFYGNASHFVSNMDSYPGLSGSMAINSSGELVGVNVAGAVPDLNIISSSYVDGMSVSLRMTSIFDELKNSISDSLLREMFECQ